MRLANEDALVMLKKLGSKSVDCVLTDPPYDFDKQTMLQYSRQFFRVCKGPVIIFCPPENQWIIHKGELPKYLFWIKPISTKNTSRNYSRFVEMILVWRSDRGYNTGNHWSQYTNVFNDLVVGDSTHPYEKPISMLQRLLRNHTQVGDTVLDPFMGSGSTGMAAKLLARNFIGCEKDIERFQEAKERINAVQ